MFFDNIWKLYMSYKKSLGESLHNCEDTLNSRLAEGLKRRPRIDPPPPPAGAARPRRATPGRRLCCRPTTVQNHPRTTTNMALDFAATYKVLVLGDSNVGKTCIVHRYCDERYYDTYISTIGERRMYIWQMYQIYQTYLWLRVTTLKSCWWLKSRSLLLAGDHRDASSRRLRLIYGLLLSSTIISWKSHFEYNECIRFDISLRQVAVN